MILAALLLAALVMTVPSAAADGIAAIRAAWTGDHDYLREDQARRAARTQRIADAWSHRRATRSLNAGGDGTYRPGVGAYLRDLYHGFFEDQLEKTQARRAARDPYVADPDRLSWSERFADKVDQILAAQVDRLRRARGRSLPEAPADGARADDPADEPVMFPPLRAVPPPPPDTDQADGDAPEEAFPIPTNPTRPTVPTQGSTPQGVPVPTDVMNNEDVRNNAAEIAAAAAQMQEGLAIYEAARARAIAAQATTADGMSGTTFDSGAVAATADIGDALDVAAMSHLADLADGVGANARAIHDHLDKYRDAEDLVAQTGVSTDTLATSS